MAVALPLDEQLCFSLYATSMAISRTYKPMLDKLGLTYPQYLVLHTLWEQDDRTIGSIAGRLSLELSTITPLVKRLEAAGFVTRRRDPRDERHVHIGLTPAGDAMREQCGCLAEALLARSGMDLAELGTFNKQVQALWASLRAAPAA